LKNGDAKLKGLKVLVTYASQLPNTTENSVYWRLLLDGVFIFFEFC